MDSLKNLLQLGLILSLFSCYQEEKIYIPKQYTAEQLYSNKSIGAVGFNADETKILVNNNTTGIYNVYEIRIVDTSMKALTSSSTESFFAVDYLPRSSSYIYSADQGGNEDSHLYLKRKGDVNAIDLTPWPNSNNHFGDWSSDKKSMYVYSNKRDPKFFDIWKIDTTTWNAVLLFQNDSGYSPELVSKSERYIALTQSITRDKNELYLFDRTTNKMKRISNENEANWNPMAFEKNDTVMYYATNEGSEFSYLVKYNINSGKSERYFEDKWNVEYMSLSENEKYHTVFINEDGKNKIQLFDHSSNQTIDMPEIKDGDVLGVIISPTEKNLLLSIGSSTCPLNLYVYNIEKKELKQLTNTLNKEINQDDLVKAEVVRFKSFDGTEIPAIYYKPHQASKNSKVPALIWVHGGPGGQSRVGFSNSIQYLVNHGYAVLAVNNRGSSGYGRTFYKMDDQDHSNGDLKDCVWGKKWLQQKEYIDSNAIGIFGGSYGGCMVLGALAFQPEEFKVGIDFFGVANWLRTLRNIPPYWESFKKALYIEMGDPNSSDSVRLKNISPLYNYQKINKPLLVIQGANDVRVLKVESDEIVEGVKKNGVPVEYLVFPDEGHGFLKKENNIAADNKTLEFLEKYLKENKKD